MIRRTLAPKLASVAKQFPVVVLTGPRQSGKTTLAKAAFQGYSYVSLESLDTRDFALRDPRGFLAQHGEKVIIDEAQRAPDLLSYIQTAVDEDASPGRYILTGSQQFHLLAKVSQSLAGRIQDAQVLLGAEGSTRGLRPGVRRGGIHPARRRARAVLVAGVMTAEARRNDPVRATPHGTPHVARVENSMARIYQRTGKKGSTGAMICSWSR